MAGGIDYRQHAGIASAASLYACKQVETQPSVLAFDFYSFHTVLGIILRREFPVSRINSSNIDFTCGSTLYLP